MLAGAGLLDLIIPRGGKSLVERVQREARVPVLAHAEGLNHTYVHAAADPAMARAILANAKMRRTGVCGATETLLIDRAIAGSLLPVLVEDLRALGCTFRADAAARAVVPWLPAAEASDFDTEWLDSVLSVAVVDGVDAALAHIAAHGSEHTDAIVTEDAAAADRFLRGVDSAVALWNASTQFCDGGEFGFRRRNRHCHRTDPCPWAGGSGATDDLSLSGARDRTGASLNAAWSIWAQIAMGAGRLPEPFPGCDASAAERTPVPTGQRCRLTARDPVPRFGDRRRMRVGLLGGSFNPAHQGHRARCQSGTGRACGWTRSGCWSRPETR